MSDDIWKEYAKGIIRAELARRNVKFSDLAVRLKEFGVTESPQNLSNKIARGTFSAVFLFQVLHSIGATELALGQNPEQDANV